MTEITSQQERHELLIENLSKCELYQTNGEPRFKISKQSFASSTLQDIGKNDINKAVALFTDSLNINGGNIGDFDLYELLQAYITKPLCRENINKIVKQHLFNR
jgi:hypothetical protein